MFSTRNRPAFSLTFNLIDFAAKREAASGPFRRSPRRSDLAAIGVCVQPVSATPLVVYRLAFGSPRSFADVD
jgi:hypothetical protein